MIKKKIKKWSVYCLSAFIIASAGCSTRITADYQVPEALSTADTSLAAENEKYKLRWDDAVKCAMLCDKSTGYIWSTTPYSAYSEQNDAVALNSALCVEYYDLSDSSMQVDKSYNCVIDGTVASEKAENGIRIIYYFRTAEITVPVYYELTETGLRVSIKASEITESGKTKLIAVSLVPYLCSVPNTQNGASYLFIPAGEGALMYTNNEVSTSAREYQGEVYGTDASRILLDDTENEEKITCPVFGAKAEDDNALFAVIEEGAEAARINAASGSMRYGYSNLYATFYLRGFDEIEQIIGSWRSDALALAETWSQQAVYSVHYIPLSGESASYSGMAAFYQKYLAQKQLLEESRSQQKIMQVEMVGGALTKKFFLGVPYQEVVPLTTMEQALKIAEELSAEIDGYDLLLSGYGSTGADVGKIAGGYTFSRILGSQKSHMALKTFCDQHQIGLFTDFELIYYSLSGNGFSSLFDPAKTANLQRAGRRSLMVNNRFEDENAKKAALLKRSKLEKAAQKLLTFTKNFSGVGLGSLGETAYSDYANTSTYMKDGMEEQAAGIVQTVKKAGKQVLLRSANSYCAGLADVVADVPLDNGGYRVFDVSVPFYQMVFRGSVPLYSTPINLSDDSRGVLLKAMEAGVSPGWRVAKSHDARISRSRSEAYYAMEYDSLKDEILAVYKETAEYYKAIATSKIRFHEIPKQGISKTVFENGVTIYINHTDRTVQKDGYTIEAKDYVIA